MSAERITVVERHQPSDTEEEVTPAYCYEQAARCLKPSANRDFWVEGARAWRELGDSLVHMLDIMGEL